MARSSARRWRAPLVADPKILLLDDPLRNVDAKLRYEMRLELPSLLKASGSTVLYVTQDYKEAMALGDRIAVLAEGDFTQIAPPGGDLRQARDLERRAAVRRSDDQPHPQSIRWPRRRGRRSASAAPRCRFLRATAVRSEKACVLGLRPESIAVEEQSSPESFPVEVVAVTPLNEKTLLLLRADDGREILASEAGTDEAPRRHGPAFARFDPSAALLFDSASGRRIAPHSPMSAMSEPALSLNSVDKIYQRRGKAPVHAVKSLSMGVNRGEIVALLGSSGCGKTSTLRMIAGFEEVTRGDIALEGRRVDQMPPARRKVAMAFEGYSLYPPLTVRDNIAFALKSARMSAKEVEKSVTEISRLVEIEPILDRYPSSISGGQQQRASLARALVRQADLYLLDEPMGQLEPQLRSVLRGRLKSLLVDRRMTSIFVTHDQTEANALADRVAVMEGGVLQQFASQKDLRERPANLYVATFVGEPPMNVFEARVSNADRVRFAIDNGPTLDFAASEIPQSVRTAIGGRDKVVIGARPHAIRLGVGPTDARVVSNQWLGDQSHLAMEVAGKLLVAVSHARIAARSGENIRFGVAASDLHIFDPATTAAVSHGLEAA